MSFYRKLTVIILSLSLGACSTFGFLFERLPWLSSWQLSRMFDLNDQQEEQVEVVAEEMKAWFLKEGFPVLVADLNRSSEKWQSAPSAEDVSELFDTLERNIDRFLSSLAPRIEPLWLMLDDSNLDAFDEYIEEGKERWFKALTNEEDKEDQRIERLENWFGDLNDEQVEIVRENISLLPNEFNIRNENTNQWAASLRRAVTSGDTQSLSIWIVAPSIWWTEDYAASRSENRKQVEQTLDRLVPTLTERQVEHAKDELDEWIETLQDTLEDQ